MRHVDHLLTAYLHRELPPHLRQRVERHTRVCDRCHTALVRERELARLLEAQMPAFGSPRPAQLTRLLPGILDAACPNSAHGMRAERWRTLPGVGMALLMLALAIVAPTLASPHAPGMAAPSQPAPYLLVATATPGSTDGPVFALASPTAVAQRFEMATEPPDLDPLPAPIAATPMQ